RGVHLRQRCLCPLPGGISFDSNDQNTELHSVAKEPAPSETRRMSVKMKGRLARRRWRRRAGRNYRGDRTKESDRFRKVLSQGTVAAEGPCLKPGPIGGRRRHCRTGAGWLIFVGDGKLS